MDMETLLGRNGPLAQSVPGYELRPGQLQMAQLVDEAIRRRTHALVEAPTGIGKSYAYLLPALASGQKTIVSTANKNLQVQLYEKDIPDLRRILGRDISAVMIKGRNNYLCHHKWHAYMEMAEEAQQETQSDRPVLPVIEEITLRLEDPDFDGDIEYLRAPLPAGIAHEVVSYPDDCLHDGCHFAESPCYVDTMRAKAAEADLLITNHHLLLLGLLLSHENILLPEADIYIVDEAHHLEAVATSVFETLITSNSLPFLLRRRAFAQILSKEHIRELNAQCQQSMDIVCGEAADNGVLTGYLEPLAQMGQDLEQLATAMEASSPSSGLVDDDNNRKLREHEVAHEALKSLSAKFLCMAEEDKEHVRYAVRTGSRASRKTELHRAPIHPAEHLRKLLFDMENKTVLCTSATLTTNSSFDHFRRQCGIADLDIREQRLLHIFNYAERSLLYQPSLVGYDYRRPQAYYDEAADRIRILLEVTRGNTLCLFTSWQGLDHVMSLLADKDTGIVWPLRSQRDASRRELLRWFRDTPHSVLCATRSFWEGIDIPGDDLVSVVLDKLPFPTPRDPIHERRMQVMKEDAEDRWITFREYMLPHMALTLKQGFGRLLRRQTDKGVVTVLDIRLTEKPYGAQIRTEDLPPARFTRRIGDVHRFFRDQFGHSTTYGLNIHAPAQPDQPPLTEITVPRAGRRDFLTLPLSSAPAPAARHAEYLYEALRRLRTRIAGKGGAAGGSTLEIRCPAAWLDCVQDSALEGHLRLQREAEAWEQIFWLPLPECQEPARPAAP